VEQQNKDLSNNHSVIQKDIPIIDVKNYPLLNIDQYEAIEKEYWEIDDTISEQSYLSHNYLRYYGKFIPEIGRRLILRYSKKGDLIVDNMVGSGTTLVEAMLCQRNAVGFDINPLAILGSKVKTTLISPELLTDVKDELIGRISKGNSGELTEQYINPNEAYSAFRFDSINKWFDEDVQTKLSIMRHYVWGIRNDDVRNFFKLGFGSIIRRVSKAFDGEVRPHINKKKRQQDPHTVFDRKLTDMIQRMKELWSAREKYQTSKVNAYLADSTDLRISENQSMPDGVSDLIISHPPYLNSFNYGHALSLVTKYMGYNYSKILNSEIKAHPATSDNVIDEFFKFMEDSIKEGHRVLKDDGYYCIIIGDCTVKGSMIYEHIRLLNIAEKIGFTPLKVIYRKPYYSTGAYSYKARVYNYENIIVMQKDD
jgi:DNA modification methylase